jgi:undecaprenyl-diphosphatase
MVEMEIPSPPINPLLDRIRNPSPREIHLFELINRRCTHPALDWFMARITHAGLGGVQLPLVALVWWLHRGASEGKTLWWMTLASFLLSTALVHLIKRRVKRMRPVAHTEVRFLVPETRHGSFPSGHTATTFALAAVVAWHFPEFAVPLFLLAAIIGYSRVYVGVHFLSDVVAAAIIGVLSAAITFVGA